MEYCTVIPSKHVIIVIDSDFVMFRGQNIRYCQSVIKCNRVRNSTIQYRKVLNNAIQYGINAQNAKRHQELLILAVITKGCYIDRALCILLGFAFFLP